MAERVSRSAFLASGSSLAQAEGQAEGYYANELGLFKKAGYAADFQAMRGGSATASDYYWNGK